MAGLQMKKTQLLKHAHQTPPNRIVLQNVWKCVTKAKYACHTFVHPKSFSTRFGKENKSNWIHDLMGRPFRYNRSISIAITWSEDVFGQEGRILPHHHAKQGTSKTNLAFSQSYNALEWRCSLQTCNTHIMHENGFTPCRKRIPYVRSQD